MNSRRILLLASLLGIFLAVGSLRFSKRIVSSGKTRIPAVAVSPAAVSSASRALRPNYPYSVVPGGVYSAAELRYAVQKDGTVRRHYADFDLPRTHLVRLTADRLQYVSFRRGNTVSWTRKKLLIRAGEVLLTDGRTYARTRCGNRLSSVPPADTIGFQPPEEALSLPEFNVDMMKDNGIELAKAPVPGELEQSGPPLPFLLPAAPPWNETGAGSPASGPASNGGFSGPGGAPFGGFAPALGGGGIGAPFVPSSGSPAFPAGPAPLYSSTPSAPVPGAAPFVPVSDVTEIPEPSTCALLLAIAAGAFLMKVGLRSIRSETRH